MEVVTDRDDHGSLGDGTKGSMGLSTLCDGERTLRQRALFETTSRLLAAVVNEGLARGSVSRSEQGKDLGLRVHGCETSKEDLGLSIWVGLAGDVPYDAVHLTLISPLYPTDLKLPVLIMNAQSTSAKERRELDPGVLFSIMYPWFGNDKAICARIEKELTDSARNQGQSSPL